MQEISSRSGSTFPVRVPLELYGSFRQLRNRAIPITLPHKTSTYLLSSATKVTRVPTAGEELHLAAERLLHRIMARQTETPCSHATVWSCANGASSPEMLLSCANSMHQTSREELSYATLPQPLLEQSQRLYGEALPPLPLEFSDQDHQTILMLPADIQGGNTGFVCCYHRDKAIYSDTDLEMLLVLADTVVHTLHVLQHCNDLQRTARLDEQQRIARNLHDTILQDVTSAVLQLENARLSLSESESGSDVSSTELGEVHRHVLLASGLTRRMMDRLRKTMWSLHDASSQELPPESKRKSLTQRAIATVREVLAALPEETRVYFSVLGEETSLPDSMPNELLYLLREALNNVVKHAKATRVDVSITFDNSVVRLFVTDDGCGFNKKTIDRKGHPRGFGMIGMRERVDALNGKIMVTSSPGKGTKIRIDVSY